MDQTEQPILAWFLSGVLYWLAFAGASIGAVIVALEVKKVQYIFPTFAVVPIVGLALAAWVGKETFADDDVDTEDKGDNSAKTLWVGAGAVVAFFVTGGIVAGYVVA